MNWRLLVVLAAAVACWWGLWKLACAGCRSLDVRDSVRYGYSVRTPGAW